MTLGFPGRDRTLKPDILAPVGLLAECPLSVAATCLALDEIGARDWSSYGGWGSHADASSRRGWIQNRQHPKWVWVINLLSAFGGGVEGGDVQGMSGAG